MGIPVSIRTKNENVQDVCRIPLLGGFVIFLIAILPAYIMAAIAGLIVMVIWWGREPPFLALFSDNPMPLYIFVVSGGISLWNWLLAKYGNTHIRIMFMPAWALGLLGMGFAIVSYFVE